MNFVSNKYSRRKLCSSSEGKDCHSKSKHKNYLPKLSRFMPQIRFRRKETSKQKNKELEEGERMSDKEDIKKVGGKNGLSHNGLTGMAEIMKTIRAHVNEYDLWLQGIDAQLKIHFNDYWYLNKESSLGEYEKALGSLEAKQLTLDYVAKNIKLRLDDLPNEEQKAVSEWLGRLSASHTGILGYAIEKQRMLTDIVNQIKAFYGDVQQMTKWLEDRGEAIDHVTRDIISLQEAERRRMYLKEFEDSLRVKEGDKHKILNIGERLVATSSVCAVRQEKAKLTIENLEGQWLELETRLGESRSDLDDLQREWSKFNAQLQKMNTKISEVESSINQSRVEVEGIVTRKMLEELRMGHESMQRLDDLQSFKQQCFRLMGYGSLGDEVRYTVSKALKDTEERWFRLAVELDDLYHKQKCDLQTYEKFEVEHHKVKQWLQDKDECMGQIEQLVDKDRRLREYQVIIEDLDSLPAKYPLVWKASRESNRVLNYSIATKVLGVRQHASKLRKNLQENIHKLESILAEFDHMYQSLKSILCKVQLICAKSENIGDKNFRKSFEEMKDLDEEMKKEAGRLDTLNNLGLRLQLSEAMLADIRIMKTEWNEQQKQKKQKMKSLQYEMENTLKEFMTHAETILSGDMSESLEGLRYQLTECEGTEKEIRRMEGVRRCLETSYRRTRKMSKSLAQPYMKENVWTELEMKCLERISRIRDCISQWTSFENRIRAFENDMISLNAKNTKMTTNMAEKEEEKMALTRLGRNLVRCYSNVRAETVNFRLNQIEQTWGCFILTEG